MVALFFTGQPPAKAAIIVGALLLLTRRVKSQRVYAEIDWSLLLMFAGLFIIVAGAEHALLTSARAGWRRFSPASGAERHHRHLSNLVSNVPAVLLLRPFVPRCRTRTAPGWWSRWPRRWPATSPFWDRSPT